MKTALRLALLLATASILHAAESAFYTQSGWTSSNLSSNWTIAAGTPYVFSGVLENSSSALNTQTRVVYAGTTPTLDYSISGYVSCYSWNPPQGNPASYHYLRVSSSSWYEVRYACNSVIVSLWSGGYYTYLGQAYTDEVSAINIESAILGSTITVTVNGSQVLSLSDSTLSGGGLAVGSSGCDPSWGVFCGIGSVTLSYTDTTPPTAPTGVTGVAYAARVNLSWTASTDNVGVTGYKVYRADPSAPSTYNYVGSSATTQFTDGTVDPVVAYNYKVTAYDLQNNESAQSSAYSITTVGTSYSAPDVGSPQDWASNWGAGPEKIALRSGALSVRIPLPKFQQRSRGPGFQMIASWGSQFWRQDNTGLWYQPTYDLGYGLFWNFTLGSMYPVYNGNTVVRFEFQDANAVIHRLNPVSGTSKYQSGDSTYMTWDSSNLTLTFRDGSIWTFGCVSRYPEADAGARYPTKLVDANGNRIDITYQAAQGLSGTNTSARITSVVDTLTTYNWYYFTSGSYAGHVNYVQHCVSGTCYTDAQFSYANVTNIVSPFCTSNCTQYSATELTQITFTGSPGPFVIAYDGSAEVTQVTMPYHGYFRYAYGTASFATTNGTLQMREITSRYMSADTSTEQTYAFSHPSGDSSLPAHSQTTLQDPSGNQKIWYFIVSGGSGGCLAASSGWNTGLECRMETYQGISSPTLKRAVDTTWTQDDVTTATLSNPRVSSVNTTQTESGSSIVSRVETDYDSDNPNSTVKAGNVTAVREYAAGNGSPGSLYRTTTTTYITDTNYTSRNLLSLPSVTKVWAGAAGTGTLKSTTTVSYDLYPYTSDVTNITQHESSYAAGYGLIYRGNPAQVVNNGISTTTAYDLAGNVLRVTDGLGHVVQSASYNMNGQVGSVTSGANTTTVQYNQSLTVNTVTGSNSDPISWSYTATYRPTSMGQPDGSYVQYSYVDTYPASKTTTSAAGRVSQVIMDGFGRTLFSMVKEQSGVWLTTATQYDSCSCSSTGKSKKVSRPYKADINGAPLSGQTVYWTTSSSDGLGRTTSVVLPDSGSSTTSYSYSVGSASLTAADGTSETVYGTLTTITDPMTHSKRYFYDALGNLRRVEEPNSNYSALVETARYAYDELGHLLKVYMGSNGDGTFKQSRTFVYNSAGQLSSSTTPEKGTVSYVYNSDGTLQYKTDAKNQTLNYAYDSNHRLLTIKLGPYNGTQTTMTSFTYDTEPNSSFTTSYATGRMTSAYSYFPYTQGYTWHYAYDVMGRVTNQTLQTPLADDSYHYSGCTPVPINLSAQYTYDADSKVTGMVYPGSLYPEPSSCPTWHTGTSYQYSYDAVGRVTGLNQWNGSSWQTVVTGTATTYNAANQITAWQEGSYTMGRSYDAARGWMTNSTVAGGYMNMSYSYNANGQVTSITDSVNSGQSVTSYTYDNLNRLASATATNWNMAWTFDDFGNRLTQTGSTGVPTSSLTYNNATNRITNSGYSYDANGNLTGMPSYVTLSYDAFDRLSTRSSTSYGYDAFGRRVARDYNGSTRIYFYSITGQLLAEYNYAENNSCGTDSDGDPIPCPILSPGTPTSTTQYFAGQRVGQWTDRVGSKRRDASTTSHYYPYGEEITGTANDTHKFAQLYRDGDSGLDYAMQRYYSNGIGRFLTVDPKGTSAHASDPQSWNRYAYTGGDPVNRTDRFGLDGSKGEDENYCDVYPEDTAACGNAPYGGTSSSGGGGGGGSGGVNTGPTLLVPCSTDPHSCTMSNAYEDDIPKLDDVAKAGSDCANWLNDTMKKAGSTMTAQDIVDAYDQSKLSITLDAFRSDVVMTDNGQQTTVGAVLSAPVAPIALVLGGQGGTTYLGNQFYGLTRRQQAIVLLHEGVHSVAGLSDVAMAKAVGYDGPENDGKAASAFWSWAMQGPCGWQYQ